MGAETAPLRFKKRKGNNKNMTRLLTILLILQTCFMQTGYAQKNPPVNSTQLLATKELAEPLRGKNPEFYLRGVMTQIQDLGKNQFSLTLLPLEVLANRQHYITLDLFKKGIPIQLTLKKASKNFVVGNIAELNQYYIVHEEGTGNAKLIALEYRQDFQAYPASPAAYLNKTGLLDPQILNVLKGIALHQGPANDPTQLKEQLLKLTKHSNKEISSLAKQLVSKY